MKTLNASIKKLVGRAARREYSVELDEIAKQEFNDALIRLQFYTLKIQEVPKVDLEQLLYYYVYLKLRPIHIAEQMNTDIKLVRQALNRLRHVEVV